VGSTRWKSATSFSRTCLALNRSATSGAACPWCREPSSCAPRTSSTAQVRGWCYRSRPSRPTASQLRTHAGGQGGQGRATGETGARLARRAATAHTAKPKAVVRLPSITVNAGEMIRYRPWLTG
jgi:hypothetical protein